MKVCHQDGDRVYFNCPGCECMHCIDKTRWTWNGSLSNPTFFPSILVRGTAPITNEQVQRIMAGEQIEIVPVTCHSFVKDGQIEFLSDCTHALAGKTVPLEDFDA